MTIKVDVTGLEKHLIAAASFAKLSAEDQAALEAVDREGYILDKGQPAKARTWLYDRWAPTFLEAADALLGNPLAVFVARFHQLREDCPIRSTWTETAGTVEVLRSAGEKVVLSGFDRLGQVPEGGYVGVTFPNGEVATFGADGDFAALADAVAAHLSPCTQADPELKRVEPPAESEEPF